MKRKLISIILTLCICLSLLPVPAWAATETTSYYDPDSKSTSSQSCTAVESTDTGWNETWYVASGDITINGTVTVSGSVNLILADGCELTVSDGIVIDENNSLTIWGQTANYESNGKLIVNRATVTDKHGASAIGGVHDHTYDQNSYNFTPPTKAGALTVNGGRIEATGGQTTWTVGEAYYPYTSNYYIYGGDGICVSAFTLNGGTVTAQGAANDRNISGLTNAGGNGIYSAGDIVITGGSVTGTGGGGYGYGGDGISSDANRSPFTISGGTVIAQGGDASGTIYESWSKPGEAGIGLFAHNRADYSRITISGGTVEATGGNGTFYGRTDQATLSGATGGSGIVGCNYLDISAGTVTATGGDGAGGGECGVGGTDQSPGVNLTVSGSGNLKAYGGDFTNSGTLANSEYNLYKQTHLACGLAGMKLTVEDNGTVEAVGGHCYHSNGKNSEGIHLGGNGVVVTGGTVTATAGGGSGTPASGIVMSYYVGTAISISGGTVTVIGDANGILDDFNSCTVTVSGGSLTVEGGADGIGYVEDINHQNQNKGTVTVTGGSLTVTGGTNGIGNITATNINGGTVIAKGDTAAFDKKPALGAGYSHITTNPDETEVYGWTGKAEPEDTWSKTALKIQPFDGASIEFTVTATPNEVVRGGSSTLKAERTFDLGNDRTLAEDVTAASTWELTGGTASAINGTQLTVGANETAETLTVTATYTEDSKSYTGSVDVRVVAQHNHVWDTWGHNDAYHWHECTGTGDCDISADADKDSYGAHAWDGGEVTTTPTVETEGVRTYTCTTCGATRTETVSKLDPGHTHAWAAAWTTNETHHWHECGAEGCGVTANADKDGYGAHAWDGGEVTKAPTSTAKGIKTYTCTVCKATKTEEIPIPTYTISGTVKDSSGNVVANMHIALKQGNKTAAPPTKTDENGNYSFSDVAPGAYNIVATQVINGGKNKTMTILVTITDQDKDEQNIKMPSDNVNSVLEVKDDGKTPDIVVGGLEAEAENQKGEDGTSIVTVTMTVESKEENDADKAEEITAIKTAAASSAAGTEKKLEYLEIQVVKTVESGGSKTTDPISATKGLLTIVIPFDFSDKVQNSVEVYRYHDNRVDPLTTADNGSGEKIVLGEDSITLYVNKFSTYAVGYVLKNATTPPGGGGGGTGSGFGGAATYAITVPSHVTGGTVQSSFTRAMAGQIVTLTVKPDAGYGLGGLTATDSQGKALALTAQGGGKYTFTMPARDVTVNVSFTKTGEGYTNCHKDHTCPIWPFTDAGTTAWYHDGVHYCIENGLMSGYGDSTFRPNLDTSRAMVATILWRLEGSPVINYILPFDDVSEGAWYADAVRWAAASGVVSGYGNGLFDPNNAVTREQMAAMLYRYAKYKGYGTSARTDFSVYTDSGNIDDWAMEAMHWANAEGLITGRTKSTLVPKGTATRAEAATMLMRFASGSSANLSAR